MHTDQKKKCSPLYGFTFICKGEGKKGGESLYDAQTLCCVIFEEKKSDPARRSPARGERAIFKFENPLMDVMFTTPTLTSWPLNQCMTVDHNRTILVPPILSHRSHYT